MPPTPNAFKMYYLGTLPFYVRAIDSIMLTTNSTPPAALATQQANGTKIFHAGAKH
jgi:hypothetical protein